jgi:hypothetical protein
MDLDTRAEMLRCIGGNFSYDGITITPTYRKPFDVLAEISESEEWRPQGNVNRTVQEFAEVLMAV